MVEHMGRATLNQENLTRQSFYRMHQILRETLIHISRRILTKVKMNAKQIMFSLF